MKLMCSTCLEMSQLPSDDGTLSIGNLPLVKMGVHVSYAKSGSQSMFINAAILDKQ